MNKPTDAELIAFAVETGMRVRTGKGAVSFARAVLARWGAQQAPDPRPVIEMCKKALAEELAAWDIDPPLHHVLEAHDACTAWLAAAPQPVGREPLTHAQAKALVSKYGNDPLHLVYQVEVAHGITKGGQHGTD